jgi:hypothetical protein
MTICIITGSTHRDWVRAISGLRRRGVGVVVVLVDRLSFSRQDASTDAGAPSPPGGTPDDDPAATLARAELAACRHALAEYDIVTHVVGASDKLSDVLGERSRVRA